MMIGRLKALSTKDHIAEENDKRLSLLTEKDIKNLKQSNSYISPLGHVKIGGYKFKSKKKR